MSITFLKSVKSRYSKASTISQLSRRVPHESNSDCDQSSNLDIPSSPAITHHPYSILLTVHLHPTMLWDRLWAKLFPFALLLLPQWAAIFAVARFPLKFVCTTSFQEVCYITSLGWFLNKLVILKFFSAFSEFKSLFSVFVRNQVEWLGNQGLSISHPLCHNAIY